MECRDAGPIGMDQALLQVRFVGDQSTAASSVLSLWTQSSECYKCPLIERCRWTANDQHGVQLLVDTRYRTNVAISEIESDGDLCSLSEHFGEHGKYNLSVSKDGDCRIAEVVKARNGNLPVLYVFLVYVLLWLVYYGAVYARRYWIRRRTVTVDTPSEHPQDTTDQPAPEEVKAAQAPTKRGRLRSLDTFRGISIAIMIFVNLGGGGYYFFNHSIWNGLTVADLVFPWFMYIMGTSMYLAMNGAVRKQIPLRSIWLNVLRRSAIMFLLGLFLNGGEGGLSDWRTLRILGVLQRFGITYFVVGSFVCLRFLRTRRGGSQELQDLSIFGDIKAIWLEWILILLLVSLYLCLTFLLPVPGCPAGYLGPGGLANNGSYFNCTGGAAGYIDRTVLSDNHTYAWPTCKPIYQNRVNYDPEGILGQLTACLTVFLGLQAGATLATFSSHRARSIRWIVWGLVCGVIGGVLCTFSKNDGWIPINKNLWSLSFVLSMGAMSFIPLSLLYFIIDVKHWWDGAPFYQAGMNSIVLYMAHECFGNYLPFSWQPVVSPLTHAAQLSMNAWATSLFVALAIYMHHKRIFISI